MFAVLDQRLNKTWVPVSLASHADVPEEKRSALMCRFMTIREESRYEHLILACAKETDGAKASELLTKAILIAVFETRNWPALPPLMDDEKPSENPLVDQLERCLAPGERWDFAMAIPGALADEYVRRLKAWREAEKAKRQTPKTETVSPVAVA